MKREAYHAMNEPEPDQAITTRKSDCHELETVATMSHVRRNVVLASIAAVSISLISTAFLTSQLLRGGGPDWSYYGYPFPIYRVENVDIVGTFHYFSPSSLVGDILVWFGASFVVISAFNAAQFMKHVIRNVAFVSTAGVAISLVSGAFLTSKLSPYNFYYGFPLPIYEVVHGYGAASPPFFFIINAVGDFLVWSGIALVLVTALYTVLPRTPVVQDATASEIVAT
jgi:hypothetical protein